MRYHRYYLVILLFLLFGGSILGIQKIRTSEIEMGEILSNAEFTVYNLDILSTSADTAELHIVLNIGNINMSQQRFKPEIESIDFVLSDESEQIISGSLPPEFDYLDEGLSEKNISVIIPLEHRGIDSTLLSRFFFSTNFSLDISGLVNYKFIGLKRSVPFNNTVFFRLKESNLLDFTIDNIDLPVEDSYNSLLTISIFNPYSANIFAIGSMNIALPTYSLLYVPSVNIKILKSSWSSFTLNVSFYDTPAEFIPIMINNYTEFLIVDTSLDITIGSTTTPLETQFKIFKGEDAAFEFSIVSINDYNLDTVNGSLFLDIDLEVLYNIPISINISRLEFNIEASNGAVLSNSTWHSDPALELKNTSPSYVRNLIIDINDASALNIISVVLAKHLNLTDVRVLISYFNGSFTVNIPDILIDLSEILINY